MSLKHLSVGQCAELACLLEVAARKPGNVHRSAELEELRFVDFLASAVAIGPSMHGAAKRPLGKTILSAVRATRSVTNSNTNLGTVLLLAPLASVPRGTALQKGVINVLSQLTPTDAKLVYQAIRLAQPGGLGVANKHDVSGAAPHDLLEAMRQAADHDLVARQYVENFRHVFSCAAPWLVSALGHGWSLRATLVKMVDEYALHAGQAHMLRFAALGEIIR